MSTASLLRRRLARAVACCAVGAGTAIALAIPAQAADGPTKVSSQGHRAGGTVVHDDSVYEYAPAVLHEGGKYKMWWCSQVPSTPVRGDDILYAESSSPDGPFRYGNKPYFLSFHGSGGGAFDGQHTCDPSVVHVGATYYLYYGAAVHDGETSIGIATSADGIHWTRGGQIVAAAHQKNTGNKYGAGQPSVVFKDGQYYLIFTDTTGAGALPNGAGQFAWRSPDPTFRTGTQVYTATGWAARTSANSRSFSVANAFSADWQYSDQLGAFIVAHNNGPGATLLTFLDGRELKKQPFGEISVPSTFTEGPGLISTPDKHSLPGPACNRFPVDWVQSVGKHNNAPADLRHFGTDLVSDANCGQPSQEPPHSPSASPSHSASASPSHSASTSSHPSASSSGAGGGSGSLPITGTSLTLAGGIGAALLAGGVALFVLARRRRTNGS